MDGRRKRTVKVPVGMTESKEAVQQKARSMADEFRLMEEGRRVKRMVVAPNNRLVNLVTK